ncbi:hypothetical protein [Solirubrobacter soli]|uniref:hypothetical protein n=1 Tax=Solirubrobacter soli TaxID=363832 RepID=UPI00146F793B|nr:hypothetical protein [Solirubrobacter soli]
MGLAVLSPAPARAQEQTPSPKELWQAYPLQPGQAPATVTPGPSASASAAPSATPAGAVSADDGGGGVPLAVPIGLAAVLAFGAGVGLGLRRRRERPIEEPAAAEPVAPRRFQWRDYPQPARPAPPPPPVPGARAPSFEAALEAERDAVPARTAQREPH